MYQATRLGKTIKKFFNRKFCSELWTVEHIEARRHDRGNCNTGLPLRAGILDGCGEGLAGVVLNNALAARGSSLEFEIAVSEYSRGELSIPADLRADSGFQNLPEALNNSN